MESGRDMGEAVLCWGYGGLREGIMMSKEGLRSEMAALLSVAMKTAQMTGAWLAVLCFLLLSACSGSVEFAPTQDGAATTGSPAATTPHPTPAKPQDEARQNVKEIAAAALAHYEATGKVCGDAAPVPTAPPLDQAYAPVSKPGHDFQFGNAENGWMCLGWKPSQSAVRYQSRYGTEGKAFYGIPGPGPGGFVAAEFGDLNADGTLFSTFYIVGTRDPISGKMTLGEMVVLNEGE